MLILALLACRPWDNLPEGNNTWLDDVAWDPAVVPAADGVYVRLPAAGDLVRVKPDGTFSTVDLRGAAPETIVPAPDGETLLVTASWPVCDDDDPRIRYVSDCDDEDLSVEYELDLVREGEAFATAEVPPQFNAFAFSDPEREGGALAVAYLDLEKAGDIEVDGILNLTEAVFVELGDGTSHAVPVGFAAEEVLFTEDGGSAVVLSRSRVAMVDLDTWSVVVSFPLTLDPDQDVQPTDVELITHTDDAGDVTDYALVSIEGREDLYVLDITNQAIDIVELPAVPSDMLVDSTNERTVIVYGRKAQVDTMEHDRFELTPYELDEPANTALGGDGMALLYYEDGSYHDVIRFDPATGGTIEYRAENPVSGMYLTADHSYAVATLDPESGSDPYDGWYGVGIFDLTDETDPVSFALSGAPIGFEMVETDGVPYALVLVEDHDELLSLELPTAASAGLALEEPPTGIAAMPGGLFVVTHPSALGLLSFVDPSEPDEDRAVRTAGGFATAGLLSEPELPRRNEE
ncbi:MAG: hypothetical protein ACOZNI_13795 [Myxococcota bacterium]